MNLKVLQLKKISFVLATLIFCFAQLSVMTAQTGGTVGTNQTICFGETPDPIQSLTLPPLPAEYNETDLEYLWMYSTASQPWTPIPGSTSATYQPGALGQTTNFIRCIRRPWQDQEGSYPIESNLVTITVISPPSFTINSPNFGGNNLVPIGNNIPFNVSTSTPVLWDFGDGTTSTSANTNHSYSSPGTYTVTLTLFWAGDCELELTTDITVFESLPVRLSYFDAKQNKEQIELTWATASEDNNSHFVIERSIDGTDFKAIATIIGNGTTSELINYSYIDDTPLTAHNYYRLKQVDFNGDYSYSDLVLVEFKLSDQIVFTSFPNPVSGKELSIRANITDGEYWVNIYNLQGMLIQSSAMQTSEKSINVELLHQGLYVLQIVTAQNEIVYNTKLIRN